MGQHNLLSRQNHRNRARISQIQNLIPLIYRQIIQSFNSSPFSLLQQVLRSVSPQIEFNQPFPLGRIIQSRIVAGQDQSVDSACIVVLVEESCGVASLANGDYGSVDETGVNDSLAADCQVFGAAHVRVVADKSSICEEFSVEVLFVGCVVGRDIVDFCLIQGEVVLGPGCSFDSDPDSETEEEEDETEFAGVG